MKKLVLLFLVTFVPGILAADSFKFTEKLADTVVTLGGTQAVKTTISGTISASLAVPNLAANPFATDTTFLLRLGTFRVQNLFQNARAKTANSVLFVLGNELGKEAGRITFTRSGALLNISATLTDINPNAIVTKSLTEGSGTEFAGFQFEVAIGSATYTNNVFYKAVKTTTARPVGPGLRTYTVTGELDLIKPTVAITAPALNARLLTEPPYTVTGKATDAYGLREVLVYVGTNLQAVAVPASNGVWTAQVSMDPGPQTISAESRDRAGNLSTRAAVKVTRVVTAPLALTVSMGGTVSGATNAQPLELGKSYTLRATPKAGFKFDGWTGTFIGTNPALTFQMVPGVNLQAHFSDSAKPTLTVTAPRAAERVFTELVTVSGKATDNLGVQHVELFLNGTHATNAEVQSNGVWTVALATPAGPNTILAQSVDAAGNRSTQAKVQFTRVVTAPVTLIVNGFGTVSGATNAQLLELGKSYTLRATPKAGFKFDGWTGTFTGINPALTFQMVPGVNLQAHFSDSAKPTLTVTAPRAAERVFTELVTVSGKATDNLGVQRVELFLNGTHATNAEVQSNGVWTVALATPAGPNTILAQSVDAAGNRSTQAKVQFTRVVTAPLTLTVDGPGTVTGATNNQRLEIGKAYTLRAVPRPGNIFDGWVSATATNMSPALTFTNTGATTFHATFGTNVFSRLNGTLTGLFRPDPLNAQALGTPTNSGYFTITVTATGAASGKIMMEGATYPFSGAALNSHGSGHLPINRPGKPSLLVSLTLGINTNGVPSGFGRVSDGAFQTPLWVDLVRGSGVAYQGRYTFMAFEDSGQPKDPAIVPLGLPFGTIDASGGSIRMVMNLPDGTTFSTSASFGSPSATNEIRVPIYASLQSGKGMYLGWLLFSRLNAFPIQSMLEDGLNQLTYPMTWTKGPSSTGPYTNGFTNLVQQILGLPYTPPTAASPPFMSTNIFVKFEFGNLPTAVVTPATFAGNTVSLSNNLYQASIKINPATGVVTGSFNNPATGQASPINAILLRHPIGFAFGYFLGANQSGYFAIDPEGVF